MIGVGVDLFRHNARAAFPAGTVWGVDFVNNYAVAAGVPVTPESLISVARASSGLHQRLDGGYETFAANTLRRTNKGALIEPAYTQYANNNFDYSSVVDGVLGSGGLLPDHISYVENSGLYTFTVAAVTRFGLPFLSLRLQGTNNTGSMHFPNLSLASSGAASAAQSEDWVAQIHARISAGAPASGGGTIRFSGIREFDAGAYRNQTDAVINSSNFEDYVTTKTLSDASTDNVQSILYTNIPPGQSIDVTIELGMWELYKSDVLPQAPVISTSDIAMEQPADALTLHLPSAMLDLTIQFDDMSQQVIGSVAGGDYLLPTLNRPIVRSIAGDLA